MHLSFKKSIPFHLNELANNKVLLSPKFNLNSFAKTEHMKYLIYGLFIIYLITACNSSSNQVENTNNKEQDTNISQPVKNPVVTELSAQFILQLEQLMPKEAVNLLQEHQQEWEFVQTDEDFARVYHQGKAVFSKVEELISKAYQDDAFEAMTKLQVMEKTMLFEATCAAECSIFYMCYNFKNLQKLAKYTKGTADDNFMSLKIMAEGDYGSHEPTWLNFFERTWDYGGGSLLGNGLNYQFLKTSSEASKQSSLFKKDIELLRARAIQDLQHPIYMSKKDKVLAELTQILNTNILSSKEKQTLLEFKLSLEDPAKDQEFQFNCSDPDQNCDWGG